MMLVLAVRTDPERVYRRALRYFTPDELGEAFAATRGVASPTQLRAFMKRDPRDLLAAFRSLAPPRKPIVLQRWSVRRVSLACGMLVATTLAVVVGGQAFYPLQNPEALPPQCGTGDSMILAAQAVPSAAQVPCVAELPSGWQVSGADIASGHAKFWLDSDQAGYQAVTVTLVRGLRRVRCPADPVRRAGNAAVRATRRACTRSSASLRYYTFPGGCATYHFDFAPRNVTAARDPSRRRRGLRAPSQARRPRPEHRGPGAVRTWCGMPWLTRHATAERPEHALLASPWRDIAVTAVVLALTALVLASVAGRGVPAAHPATRRQLAAAHGLQPHGTGDGSRPRPRQARESSTSHCRSGSPSPDSSSCAVGGGIWQPSSQPLSRRRS